MSEKELTAEAEVPLRERSNKNEQDPSPSSGGANNVAKMAKEIQAIQQAQEALVKKKQQVIDQVQKISSEGGESGLQKELQKVIPATKKLESTLAQTRKKVENSAREHEQLKAQLSKAEQGKKVSISICKQLEAEIEKMNENLVKQVESDAAQRQAVQDKISTEIENLKKKLNEEDEKAKEIEKANAPLREEYAKLREGFESKFKEYENDWKLKETETKLLLKRANDEIQRNDQLQMKFQLNQQKITKLLETAISYETQVELYEAKFGEFEGAADNTDGVMNMIKDQKEAAEAKIRMMESQLDEQKALKKQSDIDAQNFRNKVKALKTKLHQAERAKANAETKCRDAQAKREKQKAGGN